MLDPTTQLLRGTLHMLILEALSACALHGYGIVRQIEEQTDGVIEIEDGALYQALHRMQERRWVQSGWGHGETGKRARFYQLTDSGRRRLRLETASWWRYVAAVSNVVRPERA